MHPFQEKANNYAIYCRKSTDEKGKQETSIEDQRFYCEELVKKEELNVIRVVEEKKSAKVSGVRPLFNKLIDDTRTGKIDGIIAWHPDRLARNMGEGGQIIELVDSRTIKDLRFCTQQFSRDANGKMLLGLAFVLSKQYSDKLSDDVRRGNEKSHERGFAIGRTKHGYDINENGRYTKGKFWDLIQESFKMKLQGFTEPEIRDFLNKNGYIREIKNPHKQRAKQSMSPQKLNKIFRDRFYTGLSVMNGIEVYLPDLYEFHPIITEDEYWQIQRLKRTGVPIKKDCYLRGKIFDAKHPGMEYKPQVIKNKIKTAYLYYIVDNSHKKKVPPEDRKKLVGIRAKKIVDALDKLFRNINPKFTEDNFKKSIRLAREYSEEQYREKEEENKRLNGMVTRAQNELDDLEENYLLNGRTYDKSERDKYKQRKEALKDEIGKYAETISSLAEERKNLIPSFENFLNTIKTLATSYKSMDGNTKLGIAEIMVQNIFVSEGKVLRIELNEIFEDLFLNVGWG
jgi:DNA invertase Pin-like site-specific DNA recombinase